MSQGKEATEKRYPPDMLHSVTFGKIRSGHQDAKVQGYEACFTELLLPERERADKLQKEVDQLRSDLLKRIQQEGVQGVCSDDGAPGQSGVPSLKTATGSAAPIVPDAPPHGPWIPVETLLPEPGVHVLAYVIDPKRPKWSRRIRAQYAAMNTLELSDEHDPWDGCTQKEEGGQWYVESGWYETNEYEETNWRVSDKVTHYMSLPDPPTPETK